MAEHGIQSFGRQEKIRKRRDYLTIYQRGVRLYSEHFIIMMYRNEAGLKRLGITASKKVGNAVRRNRIKRLVREFFRQNKNSFKDSQDIVIIAKRAVPALTYGVVYEELGKLLINKVDA